MVEIAELWVYPIKSLFGVRLDTVEVEPRGLRFDRRWMLTDPEGSFITQRDETSLLKFRVEICGDGLRVSAPGNGSCLVPFISNGPSREVRVWQSNLSGLIVSREIDGWFSGCLGRPCHLVALPEDCSRTINPIFGAGLVAFADSMPILVLSEASLADLNSRLDLHVPANRFRANVIIRGMSPYEEDAAVGLSSGEVELRPTKRCGRCVVTCTNQITGERSDEPLRTLAGYRLYDNNACMGMYYVPATVGQLKTGDELVVGRP